VTVQQQLPGNLSAEDWAMMREIIGAVRQAVPDAANAPPGAVLEHVLTVLRAANAKVLDSFRERLIYAQSAARAVHKRATNSTLDSLWSFAPTNVRGPWGLRYSETTAGARRRIAISD
jgi:hypothetical protein